MSLYLRKAQTLGNFSHPCFFFILEPMRDRKLEARESADSKLVEALLNALRGTATSRPRQKTSFNAWRKTQRTLIDERVKSIAEKQGIASDHLVALRLNVGREMFDALSAQEKEYWKSQAKLESEEELRQWKLRNSAPSVETDYPPNSAKDRQLYVQKFTVKLS